MLLYTFLNGATRKFKTTCVASTAFLLESINKYTYLFINKTDKTKYQL